MNETPKGRRPESRWLGAGNLGNGKEERQEPYLHAAYTPA